MHLRHRSSPVDPGLLIAGSTTCTTAVVAIETLTALTVWTN